MAHATGGMPLRLDENLNPRGFKSLLVHLESYTDTPKTGAEIACARPMKQALWRAWIEDKEYDEVRLWFQNMARRSEGTAEERIRILYRYCQTVKQTPREIAERCETDLRKVENQMMDFIADQEKAGRAPSYIQNYVTAWKSWLRHNNVRTTRPFNIRDANATPTLEDERVPTKDELRSILSTASPRGRVIAGLMAFTGVRPEVLGNMRGTDGLRIKDIPDLKIEGKNVTFENIPAQVIVRPQLSKAKHRYFTFLGPEGCDYLKAYLEQRIAGGEELSPDSPVIRVSPGFETMGQYHGPKAEPFIVSRNITREVREAMRPRYTWRPYVLRAYFDTQLLLAESSGRMSHSYRAFFMGHKGDIEARYTVNKGRLSDAMITDMRKCFANSLDYLETGTVRAADDSSLQFMTAMLLDAGYPEDRIGEVDLGSKTAEEWAELLRKTREDNKPKENPKLKQKLVAPKELEKVLAQGWTVKMELRDGRILVEGN
jgi:hypothetical protein